MIKGFCQGEGESARHKSYDSRGNYFSAPLPFEEPIYLPQFFDYPSSAYIDGQCCLRSFFFLSLTPNKADKQAKQGKRGEAQKNWGRKPHPKLPPPSRSLNEIHRSIWLESTVSHLNKNFFISFYGRFSGNVSMQMVIFLSPSSCTDERRLVQSFTLPLCHLLRSHLRALPPFPPPLNTT